ncbi:DNA topoisomerase I, partial [Candidatus Micrarchaeota archaeon CG11_big_fil_rev_8_21_14_0_20_47_5]
SKNPKYSVHAGKLLSEKRFAPNEGKKEDPAHPAIHPTGLGGSMGVQEEKLYDLIVRRFLSTFAQDARRESQKVAVDSNGEKYIASGNRTVFEGWFEIYKPYLKLEEVTLPPFSEGERIALENLRMEEKKTKPPKRYTPASIISALEKVKLGTKATRASIVETLFKRGYVGGKQIEVTPFGMSLYRTLSKNVPEILDEEMTRNIEEEMEKIQLGEIEEGRVIEDGKEILSKTLEHFVSVEKTIGKTLSSGLVAKRTSDSLLGKCSCGGDLRAIISRAKKRFVGCSNYPKCTLTYPLPQEGKIEPLGSICEKCKTPQIKVTRKGRRPFLMCLLPTCETKKDWGKPKNASNAQKKN